MLAARRHQINFLNVVGPNAVQSALEMNVRNSDRNRRFSNLYLLPINTAAGVCVADIACVCVSHTIIIVPLNRQYDASTHRQFETKIQHRIIERTNIKRAVQTKFHIQMN